MTDRPIIFSAPMVRALLDGTKTQTRRILKPQPPEWRAMVIDITKPFYCEDEQEWGQVETIWSGPLVPGMCEPEREEWRPLKGLRYAVGDLLWVRENWFVDHVDCQDGPYRAPDGMSHDELVEQACLHFGATDDPRNWEADRPRWKPSIHMPRWASRLTLTVTDVSVERLQDISEEDAIAEGIERFNFTGWGDEPGVPSFPEPDVYRGSRDDDWTESAPDAYRTLWDSINGPDAWDANPWVVAVSFEIHQCNIDQMVKQQEVA